MYMDTTHLYRYNIWILDNMNTYSVYDLSSDDGSANTAESDDGSANTAESDDGSANTAESDAEESHQLNVHNRRWTYEELSDDAISESDTGLSRQENINLHAQSPDNASLNSSEALEEPPPLQIPRHLEIDSSIELIRYIKATFVSRADYILDRISRFGSSWPQEIFQLQCFIHASVSKGIIGSAAHLTGRDRVKWKHNWRKKVNRHCTIVFECLAEAYMLHRKFITAAIPMNGRRRRWKRAHDELASLCDELRIRPLFAEMDTNVLMLKSFVEAFFLSLLIQLHTNFPLLSLESKELINTSQFAERCFNQFNHHVRCYIISVFECNFSRHYVEGQLIASIQLKNAIAQNIGDLILPQIGLIFI
jgi:hypothetical protein